VYICETCVTPLKTVKKPTNVEYLSVEGCLIKVLTDVARCWPSTTASEHESGNLSKANSNFNLLYTNVVAAYFKKLVIFVHIVLFLEKEWKAIEQRLLNLSSLVDPVILIRILLHKLSWDAGLVKQATSNVQKLSVVAPLQKSKSLDRRPLSASVRQLRSPERRRTSSLQKLNEKGHEVGFAGECETTC